jgi:hypothetical protein
VESSDAEALPVDQKSLLLKSPWRGTNPAPRFYDEINDAIVPRVWANEMARHLSGKIDDDIMSILRQTVQGDEGEGENPS